MSNYHKLYSPQDTGVVFIDHQPQMTFGVASINRASLINTGGETPPKPAGEDALRYSEGDGSAKFTSRFFPCQGFFPGFFGDPAFRACNESVR